MPSLSRYIYNNISNITTKKIEKYNQLIYNISNKMDKIICKINEKEYILIKEKFISRCNYFRSMFKNFKEKDSDIIELYDIHFSDSALKIFFDYINDYEVEKFVDYCYEIYYIMIFFGLKEELIKPIIINTINIYTNQCGLTRDNINMRKIISIYHISKEIDEIKFGKLFKYYYISDNYIELFDEIYNYQLKLDEFLIIYEKILKQIEENKNYEYLKLLDILELDINYQPSKNIFYRNHSIKYEIDEKITVNNMEEYKLILEELSYGFFDNDFNNNFNWDNIVVAGGFVLAALLKYPQGCLNSDIDFWIYGNKEFTKNKLKYIINFIAKKFDNIIFYAINESVITICIPEYNRNIQIINTNYENYCKIIENFDSDYIKCLYNGKKILGTIDFAKSLSTQCVNNKPLEFTLPRLAKIINKGYSLQNKTEWISVNSCYLNPSDDCCSCDQSVPEDEFKCTCNIQIKNNGICGCINNIYDNDKVIKYLNKYYYPTKIELDNIERIKFVIKQILSSKFIFNSYEELLYNFKYKAFNDNISNNYFNNEINNIEYNLNEIVDNIKFEQIYLSPYDCVIMKLNKIINIITPYLLCPYGIFNNSWQGNKLYSISANIEENENNKIFTDFIEKIEQKLDELLFDFIENKDRICDDNYSFRSIFNKIKINKLKSESMIKNKSIKFTIRQYNESVLNYIDSLKKKIFFNDNHNFKKKNLYCKINFFISKIMIINGDIYIIKRINKFKLIKGHEMHNMTVNFNMN